jgi:hypothetical protein
MRVRAGKRKAKQLSTPFRLTCRWCCRTATSLYPTGGAAIPACDVHAARAREAAARARVVAGYPASEDVYWRRVVGQ